MDQDVIIFCPDDGQPIDEKHYAVKVRCQSCFRDWTTLFPCECDADPEELQCPQCGEHGSDVVEYLAAGRMIIETENGLVEVDVEEPE